MTEKKQQPQKQNTEICLNYIKVELSPSKKIIFIYFNDSPLKIIKKAFYFILKALFVFILTFWACRQNRLERSG